MQRGFKVLLVDDEDIFREATARQLTVRGFIVHYGRLRRGGCRAGEKRSSRGGGA